MLAAARQMSINIFGSGNTTPSKYARQRQVSYIKICSAAATCKECQLQVRQRQYNNILTSGFGNGLYLLPDPAMNCMYL